MIVTTIPTIPTTIPSILCTFHFIFHHIPPPKVLEVLTIHTLQIHSAPTHIFNAVYIHVHTNPAKQKRRNNDKIDVSSTFTERCEPDLNRRITELQTYAPTFTAQHYSTVTPPLALNNHLKSTLLCGGSMSSLRSDYSMVLW